MQKTRVRRTKIKITAIIFTFLIFQLSVFEAAASEEENVDTFSVHPAYRWQGISDEAQDQISGDTYEVYSLNNNTSGNTEFEKYRGLRSKDSTITSQFKLDIGGNQTDYFADYLGDAADFTEDVDGFTALSGSTVTLLDGGLVRASRAAATTAGGKFSTTWLGQEKLDTVRMRIKVESAVTNYIYIRDESGGTVSVSGWTLNEWSTVERSIPSTWYYSSEFWIYADGSSGTQSFVLDYVQLLGDFDFATDVNAQVEDRWDWGVPQAGGADDSKEYFFDSYLNVSDYEDTTTENWTIDGSAVETHNNGYWLQGEDSSTGYIDCNRTTLSITAATYRYLCIEIYNSLSGTETLNHTEIRDSADNLLANHSYAVAPGSYYLMEIDLAGASWTGTETDLRIRFKGDPAGGVNDFILLLNFTYLYSVSKGDLESFSGLDRMHVNPDGYMVGTCAAVSTDVISSPSGLTIDSDNFYYLKVRAKGSESIQIEVRDGLNNVVGQKQGITTTMTEYSFNLSSDSDWSDTESQLKFYVYDGDLSTLEGTEILQIDYILLLGFWSQNDGFALTLLDPSGNPAIENKFTREQDSDDYTFTFNLYDSSGVAASYSDTFEYDASTDSLLFFKLKYDLLEKEISIDVKYWDNSEAIDVNRLSDMFTDLPGNLLAWGDGNVSLCMNNTVGALARSHVIMDIINAKFNEHTWIQSDTPTDSDYLEDSWNIARVQDNIDDESQWQLDVPYLDSVSGTMLFQWSNDSGMNNGDMAAMAFVIYNVDQDDGELHELFMIMIYQLRNDIAAGPDWGTFIEIYEGGVKTQENYTNHNGFPLHEEPAVSFVIATSESRQTVNLKARMWLDIDSTDYTDYVSTVSIDDIADVPSEEFVLSVYYLADFDGENEWTALIDDFGLTFRESFSGIHGEIPGGSRATESGSSNFIVQILVEVGKLIVGALKMIADPIIEGLSPYITAVGALISSVITEIGGVVTAITDFAEDFGLFVLTFASDIGTAIWDSLGSALDFITDAIADIAADVWAALEPFISDLVSWFLGIADDVADLLYAILEYLVDLLIAGIAMLVDLLAALIFAVYDGFFDLFSMESPDLIAISEYGLGLAVELLVGTPAFLADLIDLIFAIYIFIPIFMFAYLWLVPAIRSDNIGDFFAEFFGIAFTDVTGGTAILGVHIPVPYIAVILICMLPYFAGIIPELGSGW